MCLLSVGHVGGLHVIPPTLGRRADTLWAGFQSLRTHLCSHSHLFSYLHVFRQYKLHNPGLDYTFETFQRGAFEWHL